MFLLKEFIIVGRYVLEGIPEFRPRKNVLYKILTFWQQYHHLHQSKQYNFVLLYLVVLFTLTKAVILLPKHQYIYFV